MHTKQSKSYALLASLTTALLLAAGCSKPEQTTPTPAAAADVQSKTESAAAPVVTAATQAVTTAVQQATTEVKAQTDAAQATAQKAVDDAQAQAANLSAQSQSVIDQVKALLAQNKWSEALKQLETLATSKLTPEQQATVDSLKQQAVKLGQEAAASKVTEQGGKALNNLLQKK